MFFLFLLLCVISVFFFQAEDGIRDGHVTGVQTCALPISYTVSNVPSSAEGEVLVLPMEDEAQTQGPVAVADTVRVRARDHVTIPVLANDSHPNGLPFTLDDELVEEPEEGLIFTAGDMVRFQAPDEASTVHAVYSITDDKIGRASCRERVLMTAVAVLATTERGASTR